MLTHRERRRFTIEEYLMLEERSDSRNEFHQGEIFAMAGGTLEHNLLQNNLLSELRQRLQGGPCLVYTSDVRLFVQQHSLFTYPDLLVVCGKPRLLPGRRDTLTDANLLAEVLSPSTREYDRGEKFRFYRSLPSLVEYVTLDQEQFWVERHHRQAPGQWLSTEYSDPGQELELLSLRLKIPIQDLYRDLGLE